MVILKIYKIKQIPLYFNMTIMNLKLTFYTWLIHLRCIIQFCLAGVKDIDRYHEKLTVSLYPTSLALNMERTKLGVISKEELPLHYT